MLGPTVAAGLMVQSNTNIACEEMYGEAERDRLSIMRNRIAAVLTTIAAIATFGATTADAGTATAEYVCGHPPAGGWLDNIQITINAPANAVRGQTVDLTVSMIESRPAPSSPTDTKQATLEIILGGAGSGTITATGLNPVSRTVWTGGHAQATLANAGDVSYTPGRFTMLLNGGPSGFWCQPRPPVPVVAITHVTA